LIAEREQFVCWLKLVTNTRNAMKKNMGSADRIFRTVIALVILYLIVSDVLTGVWAVVVGIVAGVFLLTSFISFCPGYLPFGWSTKGKEST
jgi:hypothetical protein